MEAAEIKGVLANCAGFNFEHGYGAINRCKECKEMSQLQYSYEHYPKMKKKLEALPWAKIVEDPRNPKDNEYPTEDGVYLTMLDADEHAVLSNPFREGHFLMYNKTHVKWWMPMPNFEN